MGCFTPYENSNILCINTLQLHPSRHRVSFWKKFTKNGMYRPEIAYQKRTWNSREQNHLPRYPLPDWPTAWPTVEGAGFCPHYPRSTPSQRLQRHPTVEGDFVFGNPGRINAHTQKQSAERAAPSSSAQRFAFAAGGRLFRRRCANRSALRTGWGKIAFGAQNGRCVTSENPPGPTQPSTPHS